jgi:phytoene synthase
VTATAIPTAPSLPGAYAHCRRLHRRSDPTYYWAARRLPAPVRPAVHALYAYVRRADDLVDGHGRPGAPDERRHALDAWEAALTRARERGTSPHPEVAALVDAARRHELDLAPLEAYMCSMRIDCDRVRIASWAELEAYMEGSAGSVGRILAPLLGASEDATDAFSRLGRGFQLANFLRDVREDRALDRIYLPAEDLVRCGVPEADLEKASASPALRAAVELQVGRARSLLAAGDEAAAAAPRSVRSGMRLARAVYEAVLDRIERTGFDVLGSRTTPSPWHLGLAAAGALRPAP